MGNWTFSNDMSILYQNANIFLKEIAWENIVCKMKILFRILCVINSMVLMVAGIDDNQTTMLSADVWMW